MNLSHFVLPGFLAFACVQASAAADAAAAMKSSFTAKGQAGMERLEQDEIQQACSRKDAHTLPAALAARVKASALATIKPPADGLYFGDYTRGEAIALSGSGLQSNDDPAKPAGGNCYACHELAASELAFGTIGPSLRQYGKLRGNSPAVVEYTWRKIYNANADMACSNMPRFGHQKILTEQQLKDLMAFLFDAASPVNQ